MQKIFLRKLAEDSFEVRFFCLRFPVVQSEPDILFSRLSRGGSQGVRQCPHFSRTFAPCFASSDDGQPVKVLTTPTKSQRFHAV